MKDWENTLVLPSASIVEVIEILENLPCIKIVLVVEQNGCLMGTVTDGDIRRAILHDISLSSPIGDIMNTSPITGNIKDTEKKRQKIMKHHHIFFLPILDDCKKVVDISGVNACPVLEELDNLAILMVGGRGVRLQPLTDTCPKPLLKIGDKPIIERIIDYLKQFGFRRFILSVCYQSHMIEAYFGNGSRFGVEISYVTEKRQMGTAGALKLLPEIPNLPFLVMNGDILTKMSIRHLLDFHENSGCKATMCVCEQILKVPFGVVELNGQRIVAIEEKPQKKILVNAGIYVLEPQILNFVPSNVFYDMTTLFEEIISNGVSAAAFPIHEYWLDIGIPDNLQQAKTHFKNGCN